MMRRLLPFLCAVTLAAPVSAQQTYGLVIGIDAYAYIPDLQGARNDALDIADALKVLDADVTLLLDEEATRAAILSAWQDILDRAAPGDRLIVTYAGHGSNEPEHTSGNEADGRDENFLLAGFAPHGLAAGERIRDDELADLIAKRPDIDVILVADACHAGTITRNLNPTLGYRYITPTPLQNDPLPPPPPRPSDNEGSDVALFLAAVPETEKVPEFLINGQARGALSYAFADGLRGAADVDGDRILTKGELETHIRRQVRQISDGVQLPQSLPAGHVDRPLFALRGFAMEPTPAHIARFSDLPAVALSGASTSVTGATLTNGLSDLRLQGTTLLTATGDPIAAISDPAHLADVVAKHRLAMGLRDRTSPTPTITFGEGDRRYRVGEYLTIDIGQRTQGNLTLLNIASDGEIQYLYPDSTLGDPPRLPASQVLSLTVQIAAPFGADHVIAIETPAPATDLRDALKQLNGTRDMATLWRVLHQREDTTYAIFPFFSEGP